MKPMDACNNRSNVTRRDFLKIVAASGLTLGLGSSLIRKLVETGDITRVEESHYLMGTIVNFTVLTPSESPGRQALRATVSEMRRLIAVFDHRFPNSPLSLLNEKGFLENAPQEMIEIILQSIAIGELTGGAFDITVKPLVEAARDGLSDVSALQSLVGFHKIIVSNEQIQFNKPGMSISLDGIAKGRIVDQAVEAFRSMDFDTVLVEAGGDLMASNAKSDEDDWTIGVSNPRFQGKGDYLATFPVNNRAVATSGDAFNYFTSDHSRFHIIDPRSGISPQELASVTTIASNATWADALSTAFMVMGLEAGLALAEKLQGVEALFVTKDLSIHHTSGFYKNGSQQSEEDQENGYSPK